MLLFTPDMQTKLGGSSATGMAGIAAKRLLNRGLSAYKGHCRAALAGSVYPQKRDKNSAMTLFWAICRRPFILLSPLRVQDRGCPGYVPARLTIQQKIKPTRNWRMDLIRITAPISIL